VVRRMVFLINLAIRLFQVRHDDVVRT